MGKWSPAYYDDLLHMKFRCLTYNAADKLQKLKPESDLLELDPVPKITHEQFIQALDVTDSFTQRIIEILVQEHAARRQDSHSNRGNSHEPIARSTRTASALLALAESCRPSHQPRPLRRADFMIGSHGWDSDGTEDAGMEDFVINSDSHLFRAPRPSLGSRIGSSLHEPHSAGASSNWRPIDLSFSPSNSSPELPPSPPPPAQASRTISGLPPVIRGRSSLARHFLSRSPAPSNSATYFRPRHRTDFESQTQRLRDRARARDMVEYAQSGPSGSSLSVGGSHVPPESFARRETNSEDEAGPSSPALPPAPVPAHAHVHSSTIRRVTSELSSLDRAIDTHRREMTAARNDFTARFHQGGSSFTPSLRRSSSPLGVPVTQPQQRESLRAVLWGGPRDEDGLPTPRSLTPEFGQHGAVP